jgi:hypothetical protein
MKVSTESAFEDLEFDASFSFDNLSTNIRSGDQWLGAERKSLKLCIFIVNIS